jgi:uracil-DNA glycosylase
MAVRIHAYRLYVAAFPHHNARVAGINVESVAEVTRRAGATMAELLERVRGCTHCASELPLGPRPVLQASATSSVVIVSQAPGRRVHASGVPFDDPSGDRLRGWLGVDRGAFYDASRFAVVPMGFCYPGTGPSGDLPPRPECAPLWHAEVFAALPRERLTLAVGAYAQRALLGERWRGSVTATVEAWRELTPEVVPLPHPSPRNQAWFKRHPWFERELVPRLRRAVAAGRWVAD